jgi:hypothetical protein
MSSNLPANQPAVNYQVLEHERYQQTQADLKSKIKAVSDKDLGKQGSLRRVVLGLVTAEKYDAGKRELSQYVSERKDYPNFQMRAEKLVFYAADLIQAIQTKRNFPGLGSLSMSKQQEIHERVLVHFEELKQVMKRIERSEKEHKLSDLRSTSLTMLVLAHSIMLITSVAFVVNLRTGLWYSFNVVFEALVEDATRLLEHIFGW